MDVELTPDQPPEIEQAVAALLEQVGPSEADPWWQAGNREALET